MDKELFIDASHPNETRVVLKYGNHIEDYEYEGLKNNLTKFHFIKKSYYWKKANFLLIGFYHITSTK